MGGKGRGPGWVTRLGGQVGGKGRRPGEVGEQREGLPRPHHASTTTLQWGGCWEPAHPPSGRDTLPAALRPVVGTCVAHSVISALTLQLTVTRWPQRLKPILGIHGMGSWGGETAGLVGVGGGRWVGQGCRSRVVGYPGHGVFQWVGPRLWGGWGQQMGAWLVVLQEAGAAATVTLPRSTVLQPPTCQGGTPCPTHPHTLPHLAPTPPLGPHLPIDDAPGVGHSSVVLGSKGAVAHLQGGGQGEGGLGGRMGVEWVVGWVLQQRRPTLHGQQRPAAPPRHRHTHSYMRRALTARGVGGDGAVRSPCYLFHPNHNTIHSTSTPAEAHPRAAPPAGSPTRGQPHPPPHTPTTQARAEAPTHPRAAQGVGGERALGVGPCNLQGGQRGQRTAQGVAWSSAGGGERLIGVCGVGRLRRWALAIFRKNTCG